MGKRPAGKLTESQLEILEAFWELEPDGATVREVWETIQQRRPLARNTVLTMIARLEKRGWLKKQRPECKPAVYHVTCERESASVRLANEFVDSFFEGSPSRLVMSLLGGRKVSEEELERIRKLLDQDGEEPR